VLHGTMIDRLLLNLRIHLQEHKGCEWRYRLSGSDAAVCQATRWFAHRCLILVM
jgi:hypothetical protein